MSPRPCHPGCSELKSSGGEGAEGKEAKSAPSVTKMSSKEKQKQNEAAKEATPKKAQLQMPTAFPKRKHEE